MHAYPLDLVDFVYELWSDPVFKERINSVATDLPFDLPDRALFEHILSTCYQASLMQEEERQVMLRIIIQVPESLPLEEGPPSGLHRLRFNKPRSFNEYELHRLAPAADFYRTLIGVTIDHDNGPQIWGLIHSGTRWMQTEHGGKKTFPPLPLSLVIIVSGPGQITVCIGSETVASLNNGQINTPSMDIFSARWLSESMADIRSEMRQLHAEARAASPKTWANLAPDFAKKLGQQVVRRIISVIRNSHHGGSLVYLPHEMGEEISGKNRYMTIKYQFCAEEPRHRFRSIMLRIVNTMAELYGDPEDPDKIVGWNEYVTCQDEAIESLNEAIFDVAHFIAALAAIDGAVVMTKRQELVGFGGVISGDIDKVETVARAMNTEGTLTETVPSEGVGTRHRAAYRLCNELHDAFAIVVSQDGNVRLVKWHNGTVTYWDQTTTGVSGF
ncbi:MAG: hypothetical protein CXR30_01735 [Geobacter sp.]|nr:MAG: hypothetical protein CXR30_01735 [Geobacter sp.]